MRVSNRIIPPLRLLAGRRELALVPVQRAALEGVAVQEVLHRQRRVAQDLEEEVGLLRVGDVLGWHCLSNTT